MGGLTTPAAGAMTPVTDFKKIGEAKERVLGIKLDQVSSGDAASGSTTVDPKGYLTDLKSIVVKSDAEIG